MKGSGCSATGSLLIVANRISHISDETAMQPNLPIDSHWDFDSANECVDV